MKYNREPRIGPIHIWPIDFSPRCKVDHGPKTSKTLEKNVRENLCDLGLDVDFLYTTPKQDP